MYDLITVNAGHNRHVQGANSKYGKEHEEARKVSKAVIKELKKRGQKVVDTTCDDHKTQSGNLKCQVDQCNKHPKGKRLDVSIHFNSFNSTAFGTECLYYSARSLSAKVSKAVSKAGGFFDRGEKERKELYFLKYSNAPAILIEVCFIDNKDDMAKYNKNFNKIVNAICDNISNKKPKKEEKPVSKKENNKPDPSHAKAWNKAVKKGIFDGTRPHEPITREQQATVLDRLGLLD